MIVRNQAFLIFGSSFGFGLKVKIDCFADILKRFLFGFTLRPAAFERRNMSDKVTILARFHNDLDANALRLSPHLD